MGLEYFGEVLLFQLLCLPLWSCLLYTSDAADERSSVDLGGRRIIKKKNTSDVQDCRIDQHKKQHENIWEQKK